MSNYKVLRALTGAKRGFYVQYEQSKEETGPDSRQTRSVTSGLSRLTNKQSRIVGTVKSLA